MASTTSSRWFVISCKFFFLVVSLFLIDKYCHYSGFKFIFDVDRSFVGPSFNYTLHIIIKGISISVVSQQDVKMDVVAYIFSHPRLFSQAGVA